MPLEGNTNQLYVSFDSEKYIELSDLSVSLSDKDECIVLSNNCMFNLEELAEDMIIEISDQIIEGLNRTILCNNWRKMHNMHMIRKQKLTQR